jgi:hypothetical protein
MFEPKLYTGMDNHWMVQYKPLFFVDQTSKMAATTGADWHKTFRFFPCFSWLGGFENVFCGAGNENEKVGISQYFYAGVILFNFSTNILYTQFLKQVYFF